MKLQKSIWKAKKSLIRLGSVISERQQTSFGITFIVKRAIRLMRQPLYKRYGVKALMRDLSHVTAEDIAFRLAPCLNAPGRLREHGASLALILLIEDDARIAYDLAQRVHMENESRKELQALCYEAVKSEAEERIANGDKVLVLLAKDAPSGIAGLLAGNLREEYGRPAIVFCPKENTVKCVMRMTV